ncbi:MAG: histidine kinase [Deltaproteobacteria bacterium]|nr:MAG: histidine kinase [Deltaproteobacteria bacterium]
MWKKTSLRGRIFGVLAVIVLITIGGGLVMVWYTYQIEGLLSSIIYRNIAAYQAAEALETALINQKGFVSYYFIDGDPTWLRQLGEYRQIFRERLRTARALAVNDTQKEAINRIDREYTLYITAKDRLISLYEIGEREAGSELHPEVRQSFFKILRLCENYKDMNREQIIQARKTSQTQAKELRIIAASAIFIDLILGALLATVMAKSILGPIRRLTREADRTAGKSHPEDEIQALSNSVRSLMDDVDQTKSELEKSREHLLQSEKMAMIGKLAAGMAHSIRNPFTSVKMRLFSLNRSLELSDTQKDDFDVISKEIRQIDTIVQNFLEFSRPPKLEMQRISLSAVVDSVMELLEHRLKSYDVDIQIHRRQPLPEMMVDPEQMKEVFVNLVINSCEALKRGGRIVIHEEVSVTPPLGEVAVIRVSDNGPGIHDSIKDKILQPFFTTKEEGTGLGLSIVARIVEEHQGRLEITSKKGEETTFIITLPLKEPEFEHHNDHRR